MFTTRRSGTAGIAALIALGAAGMAAAQDRVLEYWVYSDFAQGEALALQQEFIKEFTASHPGVSISITGKGDDDLTAGQVAGAASGDLPDVFMNGFAVGAQLVEVGALSNIYDKWMAMPESYRAQFDADALKSCMPKPEELYCLPYTGFGSLLFRNLTVLEKAGIDPTTPPATWAEWLAQMEKVKAAGMYAIPTRRWCSTPSRKPMRPRAAPRPGASTGRTAPPASTRRSWPGCWRNSSPWRP